MDNNIAIKVEHVSKSFKLFYDRGFTLKEKLLFWNRNRHEIRNVLNDISFEIKKGESVGLIGRNGCGKSTMLKMLTKIYYPNKGKITIDGRVSSLIELGAGFHPDMSGRENIYINASIYGLTRDEIDKRLDKIIEFSELRDYIDNPIRTYSSGMYMRLAFAVAINVDADILLIDEILAVGDTNFQTKCFEKLKDLQKQGITIVLVTHSMDSIKNFCNKCIWIEKGSVVGDIGDTEVITKKYIEYMSKEIKSSSAKNIDVAENNNYGTKEVEITDVKFISSGKEINEVMSNDSLDISIYFKAKKAFDNLVVGLAIKKEDKETIIYYTNTNFDDAKIKSATPKGVVNLHFNNFALQKGIYYIGVSIRDDKHTPLDIYKVYKRIDVYSKSISSGVFVLNHTWNSK